jgi:hypothetical protein
MAIQSSPIQETEAERDAALLRVKSTLLSSKSNGLTRRTTRGRRQDGRPLTAINPIPDDMELGKVIEQNKLESSSSGASPVATPVAATGGPPFSPVPESPGSLASVRKGRAMSMMSTSSSTAQMSALPTNPFSNSTAPGIRVSVTETVHVLAKGGTVDRVMVTGEISLLVRDVNPSSPLRLRIGHHQGLEKSAPNAQYLKAVPNVPGEYTIDIQAFSVLSSSASPVVAFKYQSHVEQEHASGYIPIEIKPVWRCSPTRTDLLLQYGPNPASKFASPFEPASSATSSSLSPSSLTLEDVSFIVPVTSHVNAVQSKPEGIWSPEKRRLLWKVGDVSLENGNAESNKAVARFSVNDESRPQPIAVKWRMAGRLVTDLGLELIGGDEGSKEQFDEVAFLTQAGKHLVS